MPEIMPNREIIDATQDAVLSAASSVVDVLENTVTELSHVDEAYYMHAEFWVGMAFVVAIVALSRPVIGLITKMLHARAGKIADKIQEAVLLKEDAQKLLSEYERKFRGVEKEVAGIINNSEREIELIKKEALAKLERDMEIKEREAKARLKTIEANAEKEISNKAADMTVSIVRKILNDSLDNTALSKLIDSSIDNLDKSA